MTERILSNRLIKIWFALSVMSFVILEATEGDINIVYLNYAASFFVALAFEYKFHIISRVFSVKEIKYFIVSLIISVFTTVNIVFDFKERYMARFFDYTFVALMGFMALFAVFCLTYIIVSRIKSIITKAVTSADSFERLYFVIAFAFFSVLIILAYNLTDVTYTERGSCDIVFTTDSSVYVNENVFFRLYSSENDLRQPLFALTALPFSVTAKLLSYPFFFLPSAYILIMQLLQIAVLLVTAILLGRMVTAENTLSRPAFLVLYTATYPVFLFSFVIEQYIFSLFIVIFSIYFHVFLNKKSRLLLAVSSGTLLTNAAVVPFVLFVLKSKKIISWIRDMATTVLLFLGCCILCGKLTTLVDSVENMKKLLRFTNTDGSINEIGLKISQFTYFIVHCFIAPDTMVIYNKANMPSYQLTMPTTVSIAGIVIIIVTTVGIFINIKKSIAKICGLWFLFGTVILLIIGWGSPENGMVLYTLYFSWSLFAVLFMLAEKTLRRFKVAKNIAYFAFLITLLAVNFSGVVNLIKFGITYYPAWL